MIENVNMISIAKHSHQNHTNYSRSEQGRILLNKICTVEVARLILLSHEKYSLNKQINSVKFREVDFA